MLRVELGPKEATEGACILARCRKAGAVAALCVQLWDLCLHWGACSELCMTVRPGLQHS